MHCWEIHNNNLIYNLKPTEYYKFLQWMGQYTLGDVSIRGTRIWFNPKYSKVLDVYQFDHPDYLSEDNMEINKETIINSNLDIFTIYGDNKNIWDESLMEILKIFDNRHELIKKVSSETFTQMITNHQINEQLDAMLMNKQDLTNRDIYVDISTQTINQIYFLDESLAVKEELEEVLKLCQINNIDFIKI